MVLCAHYDSGFNNERKGRNLAGVHIFLSENDAMPRCNDSVLTLAQIIKFVMSFASEAELGALFITSQEMVAMRNTMEEIKWAHPKSPIQTDNSDASGVVKNTIVPRKLKTMDQRLHWLRFREAQDQLRYYWESGNLNWGEYSTKHHPPPLSRNEKNAICGKLRQHQRHQVPVRFQQGCIVPASRWNLLPPGTLTRLARMARQGLKHLLE